MTRCPEGVVMIWRVVGEFTTVVGVAGVATGVATGVAAAGGATTGAAAGLAVV